MTTSLALTLKAIPSKIFYYVLRIEIPLTPKRSVLRARLGKTRLFSRNYTNLEITIEYLFVFCIVICFSIVYSLSLSLFLTFRYFAFPLFFKKVDENVSGIVQCRSSNVLAH